MRPRLAAGLLGIALVAAACSNDDPPDWLVERATPSTTTAVTTTTTAPGATTTTPDPGREVAAIDLSPGTCIEDAAAFTGREVNEITEARVVPCRLEHQAEVYARTDLPEAEDAPFPGVGTLRREAQAACREPFAAFVGVPWTRSELEIAALWPSPESWADHDRSIVCAVFRLDGRPLTGTARNSRV